MIDQTNVPAQGQKQDGQPASDDLTKRLEDLQKSLADKEAENAKLQKEVKSKDSEARRLQAAADQRASLLQRMQQNNQGRPPSRVPPAGGQPTANPQQEILDFANEQAKEVVLLREVVKRGLTLDDVDGVTFNSTQELQTQLDLMQQKKEIDELRKQLSARAEGGEEQPPAPSGPKIDTGGRSVDEARKQLADLDKIRGQARELKKEGKHREAVWMALRAARSDPSKVHPVRPADDEA